MFLIFIGFPSGQVKAFSTGRINFLKRKALRVLFQKMID